MRTEQIFCGVKQLHKKWHKLMKSIDKINIYFHYIVSFFYMKNVWVKRYKTDERLKAISTTFLPVFLLNVKERALLKLGKMFLFHFKSCFSSRENQILEF